MKKNKEWAFIELGKIFPSYSETYDYPDSITVMKSELLNKVYDILAQLDEPETLSEEWLEENKCSWTNLSVNGYSIPVEKLQNKLVPKQELPVIPKFVADWIEEHRNKYGRNILEIGYDFYKSDLNNFDVDDWVQDNTEAFTRAWLDGYEVEEDQRYYIQDQHGVYLLAKNHRDQGKVQTVAEIVEYYGVEEIELDYELTEQEIKDYDERYLAFKVPVEEEEE